jgi:uncharacterized protein (DUF302 family)
MGSESTVAGLITIKSGNGPEETMNRFEAEVRGRGMTVFAHIDHAASATAAGLSLRPTEVLIFGNAKAGTPLMEATQTIGIDLPLKVLVWRDENGATWLSYNDPVWLAERHGIMPESADTLGQMSAVLANLAAIATKAT